MDEEVDEEVVDEVIAMLIRNVDLKPILFNSIQHRSRRMHV